MSTVLLYVPDLMFETRIKDVARRLGYGVASFNRAEEPALSMARAGAHLLIVALDAPGWESIVAGARQVGLPILAFGSHRNVDVMRAAKEAGCTEVLARSRFAAELPSLLQKYMEGPVIT